MSSDIAWAAGFFDGEGCIQLVHRTRGRYEDWHLMVHAVNTDIRPLHRFVQLFGGSVQVLHHAENSRGFLPSWQWVVSHKKASAALHTMLPFFIVKKEQAELALLSRHYVSLKRERLTPETRHALQDIRVRLQVMKKNPPLPVETAGLSNHSTEHMESDLSGF